MVPVKYRSIISQGGWCVLSFDLVALDRWYGVGLFICRYRWDLRRNPAGQTLPFSKHGGPYAENKQIPLWRFPP